jgi:hypothetical protein
MVEFSPENSPERGRRMVLTLLPFFYIEEIETVP